MRKSFIVTNPQEEPMMLNAIGSHEFSTGEPVHIAHFAAVVLRRMRHGMCVGCARGSVVSLSADSLYRRGNVRKSQRTVWIESPTVNWPNEFKMRGQCVRLCTPIMENCVARTHQKPRVAQVILRTQVCIYA